MAETFLLWAVGHGNYLENDVSKVKYNFLIVKRLCKPNLKKFYHNLAFQSSQTLHIFLIPLHMFMCLSF